MTWTIDVAKRKGTGVVKSAGELARKASPRQRRLYGLNGARVPDSEKWKLTIDAQYLKDLRKDPVAAQWLSVFNEEVSRSVYQEGEPHLHSPSQLRELHAARMARSRNKDVTSFDKYRGPSLDGGYCTGTNPEDAWIEKIDRERSVAMRAAMIEETEES